MELSESKIFASFTTLGFLISVVYVATLGSTPEGEIRLVSNMVLCERIILGYGLLAVFLNVAVAAFDAFALGHKRWGWLNILAWPVSFIFIWLAATGQLRRQRIARGT